MTSIVFDTFLEFFSPHAIRRRKYDWYFHADEIVTCVSLFRSPWNRKDESIKYYVEMGAFVVELDEQRRNGKSIRSYDCNLRIRLEEIFPDTNYLRHILDDCTVMPDNLRRDEIQIIVDEYIMPRVVHMNSREGIRYLLDNGLIPEHSVYKWRPIDTWMKSN